ncbi:MAG: tetratricopeptide repeat protein [Candidatus Riflebacteria bacterium]|nr:tetratricopeptide repeat protein [Candidatus Riflebacteria bacterium]
MLKKVFDQIASNRSYLIFLLWILLIVTFSPVMSADYLYFDEHVFVLRNPAVTAPLTLDSLIDIFSSFETNIYTPLSVASHWLEYNLFGFNSSISHFINLLLHIACATIVFFIAESILQNLQLAFVVATVWALHPIQVESVAWVLERRNLLFGMFYFASMAAYIRFLDRSQTRDIVIATLLMLLSGLAKNLAFSLPFSWLMIDWLRKRPFTRKLFTEKIAGFLLALVLLSIMLFGAHEGIPGTGWDRLNWRMASYNLGFYAAKTMLPVNLSSTYEINSVSEPWFASGPFYLFILLAVTIFIAWKDRLCIFAALFYFVHIFPLSGIVTVGYNFYAVLHFMYVALFGVVLCVLVFLYRLIRSTAMKDMSVVLSLLLICCLAFASFNYNQVWSDSRTLLEHSLAIDPNNRFARTQLATYLESNKKFVEAAEHYKELIERWPKFFGGFYGMGRIHMYSKQNKAALILFNKAIEFNSKRADLFLDRGATLFYTGQFSAAESDFSTALQFKYLDKSRIRFWRAEARRRQGDYAGAIDDLNTIAAENPDDFSIKIGIFENYVESAHGIDALYSLLNVFKLINENPSRWEEFYNVICTPSFSEVITRMAPYRNLFIHRFNWYPF